MNNKYHEYSHCVIRVKERLGIKSTSKAINLIERAFSKGDSNYNFTDREKRYIYNKVNSITENEYLNGNLMAVYYHGCIFIFTKDTNYCITAYQSPCWFSDKRKAYYSKKHFNGKEKIKNFKKYSKNNYLNQDIIEY